MEMYCVIWRNNHCFLFFFFFLVRTVPSAVSFVSQLSSSERKAAADDKLCAPPQCESHCGFQILHSLEVISCPFAPPLLSFSIEKLSDGHTSDWQASGKIEKTAGWMLSARSAFCSVLAVLVISLTVDLVEIAGCSPGPEWSGSQQTASHLLKAGSQWTLH